MRNALFIGASILALSSAAALADVEYTILDSGTGNSNNIDQSYVAPEGMGSAMITQAEGSSDNMVAIKQAESGMLSATVMQHANASDGKVDIHQSGYGTAYADVTQDGASGGVMVGQVSHFGMTSVLIDQNDVANSNNYANAIQEGGDVSVEVKQRGTDNESYSMQFGRDNTLTATQSGTNNHSEVFQGNYEAPEVTGLKAMVSQAGDNNVAHLDQYADGAMAEIAQEGNNNTAMVTQGAAYASSVVNQHGSYGKATVSQ